MASDLSHINVILLQPSSELEEGGAPESGNPHWGDFDFFLHLSSGLARISQYRRQNIHNRLYACADHVNDCTRLR